LKVVSVIGARPQFIKAAPLSHALRQRHQEYLIHTGQHYDENMSRIFFDDLEIPRPDLNLGVGSESHAVQTGQIMIGVEKAILREKPELVLVYGDTNSTVAAALAAVKVHVPVAHVEAGLRSFNRQMPEEINRIVTDRIADFLFCPTPTAVANLQNEGLALQAYLVGDVMVDALNHFSVIAERKVNPLPRLQLQPKRYSLATVHRPANTDQPDNLRSILRAFRDSGETIVFPLHPRTRKFLQQYGLLADLHQNSQIILTEPLSYLEILLLEKHARCLLTDSGGMQKEAYLWGVPCITLREETEWVETIEEGWNCLVGADYEKILTAIREFEPRTARLFSYGDGHASAKIIQVLEEHLK